MERATPINLLPGESTEQKTKLVDESSIKMDVKKKDECKENKFKIELDMETGILILLLFLSSYLKTSNLEFLPEGIKSNLFTFSIVKAIGLFAIFFTLKRYVINVCD